MENALKNHVARFFYYIFHIVIVNCGYEFVRFFYHVGTYAFHRLGFIPFAAVFRGEYVHYSHQVVERITGFVYQIERIYGNFFTAFGIFVRALYISAVYLFPADIAQFFENFRIILPVHPFNGEFYSVVVIKSVKR